MSVFCMHTGPVGGQKRVLNPLEVELLNFYEHPCGFWELNPDPVQELHMTLTAKTSP